jgi:hypothetical protein
MINIFKSIVRTVMVYEHPLLLTASNRVWKRLQIIQNKALRVALNLPYYTSTKYIHRITNVPLIQDYAQSLLRRSIATATLNNDTLLRTNLEQIMART